MKARLAATLVALIVLPACNSESANPTTTTEPPGWTSEETRWFIDRCVELATGDAMIGNPGTGGPFA